MEELTTEKQRHRDTEAQRNNHKNHEDTKIRGTRGFLPTFPFDTFLCASVSLWWVVLGAFFVPFVDRFPSGPIMNCRI